MLAGPPTGDVEIPRLVTAIASGRHTSAVWVNQAGGITFEVGAGDGRCFVKWVARDHDLDLDAEAERLAWASPHTPVPHVLAVTADDAGSVLVTSPLPGASAVDPRWAARPDVAVRAIGEGLRHLHDHLPVTACPFSWSVNERVERARVRVSTRLTAPSDWHPDHHGLSTATALAALSDPPPIDRAVVCHGDTCAPNTIIDAGRWSGHVDLGALGIADRWADLAVAAWSTDWNYGPGWQEALLDAYGVRPDPERMAYYRLLWDLT